MGRITEEMIKTQAINFLSFLQDDFTKDNTINLMFEFSLKPYYTYSKYGYYYECEIWHKGKKRTITHFTGLHTKREIFETYSRLAYLETYKSLTTAYNSIKRGDFY